MTKSSARRRNAYRVKPEVKLYVGEKRKELVTRGQENVDKPCIAAEVECKANRGN
jgi:hypothetical protein